MPAEVQGLRCLANFEALRFSEPIRLLANTMVQRMIQKSSRSGGKYVSVHLRFEKVSSLSHLLVSEERLMPLYPVKKKNGLLRHGALFVISVCLIVSALVRTGYGCIFMLHI